MPFDATILAGPIVIAATLLGNPLESTNDDTTTGDLARIQGDWSTVILDIIPLKLQVHGRDAAFDVVLPSGEEVTYRGTVVIDETTEPKQLDLVDYRGPDGEELPDNRGIYRFLGDRLIVCNRTRDGSRPEEFTLGGNGYPLLQVYTKDKP